MGKRSQAGLSLTVILLWVAMGPSVANSEPELLAEFHTDFGCGGGDPSYTLITHLSFGLSYNDSDSCIGCELLIPAGETGEFTFDATTSPGWADVVARMVNGINEEISSLNFAHYPNADSESIVCGGGNFEFAWLRGVPDLNGAHVDFVRLVVNSVTIGPDCCSEGGGYSLQPDITWQVWGIPAFLRIDIDVKPGNDRNRIKLDVPCKNDKLPVAILSTPTFDAQSIDPTTVTLGGPVWGGRVAPFKSRVKDVDDDGDTDLRLLFSLCDLALDVDILLSDPELVLIGETADNLPFTGSDSVEIVVRGEKE